MSVSCRTTEENYKVAYDLAKGEGVMEDSLITNLIANEQAPTVIYVDGEPMKMRKEFVSIVTEEGVTRDMLKQYNVVVGRFRQLFNARSMTSRMKELGYKSFMLVDRTPAYYVVVEATDVIEESLQQYKKIMADTRVVYKAPFPWVLEPSQYVRQISRK